jgi:hypothetical protein
MPSIPGSSTGVTDGRRGVWRRSLLTASPTSTAQQNDFSRGLSKASTLEQTAAPVPGSRRFPTLPLLPLRG